MWQRTKNIYHLGTAMVAVRRFGTPGKGMLVIGVTGTDGKTTTSNLIYHILTTAKLKAAVISTVSANIDGKIYDTGFHVTTPAASQVQAYLKKAKDAGVKYVVLEVTSHALDQNRVYGVPFSIGIVTNITPEHLDYHKTYQAYVRAKFKLLQQAKVAIVNRDDISYQEITNLKSQIANTRNDKHWITYGMTQDADVTPEKFPFKTHLIGEFNQYNTLAAIAACKVLGVDDEVIREGIATFEPPVGREEIVYDEAFKVMIDFAHTPNSIKQLLSSLRKTTKGKIIHVFGSAGERDRQKRKMMGENSAEFADVIVLTAEDPRSERVENINNDIESGIKNQELRITDRKIHMLKIPDRQEAITRAIEMAEKGDMIVITGKGHERSMNFGKGEEAWNEHEAVAKALQLKVQS